MLSSHDAHLPLSSAPQASPGHVQTQKATCLPPPPPAGIYTIRITWTTALLAINSALAPSRTSPGARLFTFQAESPGWFTFDIVLPNPSTSAVDVEIRTPDTGLFARAAGWQTISASSPPQPLPPAPSFVTSRASWTVYFNATSANLKLNEVVALGGRSLMGLPAFRQVAVAPSLAYGPGVFRGFLIPGLAASAPGGAVGSILGGVEVTSANASYVFKVR